jgi:hypothetical protein
MAATILRLASTSARRAWIHELDLVKDQLRVLEYNTYHRAQTWQSFQSSLGDLCQRIEQPDTSSQDLKEQLDELHESANRIMVLGKNIYWDDINK